MTENGPNPRLVGVSAIDSTNDLRSRALRIFRNERMIVSIVLSLLIIFSVIDFFEDRAQGASGATLFNDVTDMFLPMALLIYIWRFKPFFQRQRTKGLETDLARKNADLHHWKTIAANYIEGLSKSIDEQLGHWQLTQAEKEVALLLLKGFTLRELAELRGTSERTVRQQATRVYEKAGLRGRAELSAFFLEDLMLPTQAQVE